MKNGIIVFAHGSRDPLWRIPVEAVAKAILQRAPDALVRCAYLELCEPTLAQAASDLIAACAHNIRVLPLFLGVGKHAREDLPRLMEELRVLHPATSFELLATVGENPALIALIADMALA